MHLKGLKSFAMFTPFAQPSKFPGVKSMWIADKDTTGLPELFQENSKKSKALIHLCC